VLFIGAMVGRQPVRATTGPIQMTDDSETNGYDPEEVKGFLDEIEHEQDELDALKIDHLNACKGPRGKIKKVLKAVKDAEIDVEAFKVAVKKRLADRKHLKRVEELEADSANAYEMIQAALGAFADTPLGEAALRRARGGDDVVDGLTR
jgi:hypothetical protein